MGRAREGGSLRPIVSPIVALRGRCKFIWTAQHAVCTVETTIFICNGYDDQIDSEPICEALVRTACLGRLGFADVQRCVKHTSERPAKFAASLLLQRKQVAQAASC